MTLALKAVALALIAGGLAVTIYLSGLSSALLTCAPFSLFLGATFLGKRFISGVCTVITLIVALAFGAHSYYQAFRIHEHGEVDGISLLVVPIVQAAIALFALLVAFGDWLLYRLSLRNESFNQPGAATPR